VSTAIRLSVVALISWSCLAPSAQGIDRRVRVAVVDTGYPQGAPGRALSRYMCDTGHLDLTGNGLRDTHGHGTAMLQILSEYVSPATHCLAVIKYSGGYGGSGGGISLAIDHAMAIGAAYINISSNGSGYDAAEYASLRRAVAAGIVVAVAAGNEGSDLSTQCDTYPACHRIAARNFIVVGNYYESGARVPSSNYGGPVNCRAVGVNTYGGSGTSQATAMCLGDKIQHDGERQR
jgi:subtilisin family serine protease